MSFVSVLKAIGHGVKVTGLTIGHAFTHLFGQKDSEAFAHASLDLLKGALGQIVVAEVESLVGVTDLSGVEKAAKAQSAILAQAETLGIAASKSIINLLIELAVQFIKSNLTAVAGA